MSGLSSMSETPKEKCEDCGGPIDRPLGKRGPAPTVCSACFLQRRKDAKRKNEETRIRRSRAGEDVQRKGAAHPDSLDFREGTLRFGQKVLEEKVAARKHGAPKHEEFTYPGCEEVVS
jgi:hypothetical protein